MKNEIEQGKELVDELIELWTECSKRCDSIEEIVRQIKEKENLKLVGFLKKL